MTNEQLAGARRGLRGFDVLVMVIPSGVRITYEGNSQDVIVPQDMTPEEVRKAMRTACVVLTNGQ